jgi:hypothetical protein
MPKVGDADWLDLRGYFKSVNLLQVFFAHSFSKLETQQQPVWVTLTILKNQLDPNYRRGDRPVAHTTRRTTLGGNTMA